MRTFGIAIALTAFASIMLTQPVKAINAPGIIIRPVLNPATFIHATRVTNPLFPLSPGTAYIYDGFKGKATVHDVVEVTHQTKIIDGVPTLVIVDTVHQNGIIEELTIDWYAQDFFGNVWYFGEFATQFKNGHPAGHAGSWQAGVNGAQAGIIMEATPHVGDTYFQENAAPIAEDEATVLSLTASVSTPYGNFFNNVLETKEFSPLSPDDVEHKFYVPGIGNALTVSVKGVSELLALTDIEDERCSAK